MGHITARPNTVRCLHELEGERCTAGVGPDNHNLIRGRGLLRMPHLVHQTADGRRWYVDSRGKQQRMAKT